MQNETYYIIYHRQLDAAQNGRCSGKNTALVDVQKRIVLKLTSLPIPAVLKCRENSRPKYSEFRGFYNTGFSVGHKKRR